MPDEINKPWGGWRLLVPVESESPRQVKLAIKAARRAGADPDRVCLVIRKPSRRSGRDINIPQPKESDHV